MKHRHVQIDHASGKAYRRINGISAHCESCGKLGYWPKQALDRRTQPRCSACGGYLELTSAAKDRFGIGQEETGPALKCETCGCKLRSGNYSGYCSLHQPKTGDLS
jgi:hypothetical protein